MPADDFFSLLQSSLDQRRSDVTFRSRRPVTILDSTHVEIDGRRLINFASNNYLGLTHHPLVHRAFERTAKSSGVGSGAAPLITGHSEHHALAERTLADWKQSENAVLLASGYTANLAAVQMLGSVASASNRSIRFLLDKLCHASLVDAVRSVSDGEKNSFRVFPHNHLPKLARLLEEAEENQQQVVITESIFSMDGDRADLAGIAELKKKFPFLLVLDEAHGSGVYGPGGSGLAAELNLQHAVDLTIVTLSKAIGCMGGAICGSNLMCDAIINFARPYIFSTALPPAIAAAVTASISVMKDEPQRQQRVRQLARHVRQSLHLPDGDSPIIPVILGDSGRALDAAEQLNEKGFLAVAVRPPTVARGTSRLRLTLSCDHSDQEVDQLIQAFGAILAIAKRTIHK
jgi:8-amino-7-oxononanoate synthase